MKKKRVNIIDLIKKNKEQIWNDREELLKIEERIDAKHESYARRQREVKVATNK